MQSAELVIECVYPSSRLVVLVSKLMRSLRAQACKVVAAGREAPGLESVRKRSSRMLGTQVKRDTTRVLGVSSDRGSGVFFLNIRLSRLSVLVEETLRLFRGLVDH